MMTTAAVAQDSGAGARDRCLEDQGTRVRRAISTNNSGGKQRWRENQNSGIVAAAYQRNSALAACR